MCGWPEGWLEHLPISQMGKGKTHPLGGTMTNIPGPELDKPTALDTVTSIAYTYPITCDSPASGQQAPDPGLLGSGVFLPLTAVSENPKMNTLVERASRLLATLACRSSERTPTIRQPLMAGRSNCQRYRAFEDDKAAGANESPKALGGCPGQVQGCRRWA